MAVPHFFKSKKFWLGIIVAAAALYFAIRGIEWAKMSSILAQARYGYFIPILLLIFVAYWLRAYRWQFLLYPVKKISVKDLFSITMIGFMINNVLPVRIGELYRAYAVGKNHSISKSTSLATVILERVFDVLALLLFLLFVMRSAVVPEWVNRSSGYIIAGVFVLLIVLVTMMAYPYAYVRLWRGISRWLPECVREKVGESVISFVKGLEVLRNGRQLVMVALLSLVIWLAIAITNQIALYAFSYTLPISAAFTLLVITSIGAMLPSAPGYVGTFQLFTILALAPYAVGKTEALSVSIFLHASHYIPITILGLLYFFQQRTSFREVQKVAL